MQAIEFKAELTDSGELKIPDELNKKLRHIGAIRVILLFDETEEQSWQELARDQFFKGYSEKDAAYDQL